MGALRLITIPISHYCEKARWALDRAGLPYIEKKYLPLAHRLPVKLAGGDRTVPVLVTSDGAIADSTAILRYIDGGLPEEHKLFPTGDGDFARDVVALEEELDHGFGPAARAWAYFFLLPDRERSIRAIGRSVGPWARTSLPLMFPLARAVIRRFYRINAASAARAEERIGRTFDRVAERLQKSGDKYLAGPRISAADVTFAALAAPVLFPPEHPIHGSDLDELPGEMAARVRSFRETPGGAFALRLYREERMIRAV